MRRIWSVLLALWVGVARAQDLPSKLEGRDISYQVRKLDLPSGMRIVVEQDSSRPLVSVVWVVDVGGSGDPAGKEGLAHLVEHLAFRSLQDQKHPFTDLLEAAGVGRWNAYTSWELTTYYSIASKSALGDILALEGARMLRPLEGVTPEVFDTEKQVVRNELLERDEQGIATAVLTRLNGALFPAKHPYARPVIGTEASLASLSLADAQAFVKANYRPEKITLVISGDVDPAAIGKVLDASFPAQFLEAPPTGVVPVVPRLVGAPAPPAPPPAEGDLIRVRAPSEVPLVFVGWSLPSGYDKEGYLASFVTQLTVRAVSRARAHDMDLYGVGAFLLRGKEASMLVVLGRLKSGSDPRRSGDQMMDQLFRLWVPGTATGTSDAARRAEAVFMQRRNAAYVDLGATLEDLGNRSTLRAELTHVTGDSGTLGRELRNMWQLESAQLARFAHTYLSRDRARVVFLEPSGSPATAGEAPSVFATAGSMKLAVTPAALRSRIVSPGASIRAFRLASGLEVVLARRPTSPIVAVTLGVRGGSADGEPLGGPLFADYASPVDHTHGNPENYGIGVSTWDGRGAAYVRMRAANGNLDNALAILLDRVRSLHVDSGVEWAVDYQYRDYYRQEWNRPHEIADRTLWSTVFGAHPLGRSVPPETFNKIGAGQAHDWIGRAFTPGNAVLTVAGDVELDKGERAVRAWFEGWRATSDKPPRATGGLPARPVDQPVALVKTPRPGARQVEIALGCAVPLRTWKEQLAADLLMSRMETRLHRFARLALGSSYGMHKSVSSQPGMLQLSLRGSVDDRGAARTLALLRNEAEGLGKSPPDAQEVLRSQWDEGVRLSTAYETSSGLGAALVRLRLSGLPADSLERLPDELASMTPADVQQLGAECRKTAAIGLMGEQAVLDRLVPPH
jgi:zinc protease